MSNWCRWKHFSEVTHFTPKKPCASENDHKFEATINPKLLIVSTTEEGDKTAS